jgi:hypothetical protein
MMWFLLFGLAAAVTALIVYLECTGLKDMDEE